MIVQVFVTHHYIYIQHKKDKSKQGWKVRARKEGTVTHTDERKQVSAYLPRDNKPVTRQDDSALKHINRQTDRQRDRQKGLGALTRGGQTRPTDTQTDRQTDRQKGLGALTRGGKQDRQTDRQRQRDRQKGLGALARGGQTRQTADRQTDREIDRRDSAHWLGVGKQDRQQTDRRID